MSSANSRSEDTSTMDLYSSSNSRLPPPRMRPSASSAARSVFASIRSITASAAVRSSLPFRNARSVNSPRRAMRAPQASTASSTRRGAMLPPCVWNSTASSPVYDFGEAKTRTSPSSTILPSHDSLEWKNVPAIEASTGRPETFDAIAKESGPLTRTTATPPLPGGVDTAAIVPDRAVSAMACPTCPCGR